MIIKKYLKGKNVQISDHFSSKEFDCKCTRSDCIYTTIDMDHVAKLEKLRALAGKPIHINCGFRCKAHNAETPGSAPNSQHVKGDATDITIPGLSVAEVDKLAEQIGFDGIGVYSTFIHVDSRGVHSRWKGEY